MNEIDQALTSFYLFLGWEPYTWFALFALANILDGLTTIQALALGGREINPLMRLAMQRLGTVPAIALLKLPLLVLVYVGVAAWNLREIARLKARA